MKPDMPQPEWDKLTPSESFFTYAEWLHEQAMDTFLEDKTHAQILFLFSEEEGLVSINQIPPNTTDKQLLNGVRQAIGEHNLYAVITLAETWTYFPKKKHDHVITQLVHDEMGVADLRDDDKTECLMLRMESRDGDGLVWLNRIIRDGNDDGGGDKVSLGDAVTVPLEKALKQDRYFGD